MPSIEEILGKQKYIKADLEIKAKELKIAGFSKMNKTDLIDTIIEKYESIINTPTIEKILGKQKYIRADLEIKAKELKIVEYSRIRKKDLIYEIIRKFASVNIIKKNKKKHDIEVDRDDIVESDSNDDENGRITEDFDSCEEIDNTVPEQYNCDT